MEDLIISLLNFLTGWWHRRSVGTHREQVPSGWHIGSAVGETAPLAVPVSLTDPELDRHLYVLGASGSGKSKLLELLVRAHIRQDAGFCLVDPHGDLTEAVLAFLCEERRRCRRRSKPLDLGRVYLIEPFREDGIVGLNPLDPGGGPLYPHIGELVGIFRRFWSGSWGPRMEELLRNTLLALALTEGTLVEVTPFLTDPAFRAHTLERIDDDTIRAYWRDRYDMLSDASRAAMAEPVLNKMGALLADPRLRATFGQQDRTLNLRRLMDEGAWVLLNCAKGHLRDASYVLGSLVVAQLQAAAMSRAGIPEAQRRPFTLVVDEFQNFRGEDFETILCESRKYRLRLVLAHQHLAQLDPALQNAIFGNVAVRLTFAVSAGDAAAITRGLSDAPLPPSTLTQLPVGQALLSRRSHAAQEVKILEVVTPRMPPDRLARFAAALRRQHGRDLAEIDTELRVRRVERQSAALPDRKARALPSRTHAARPAPEATTNPVLEAPDD